MLNGLILPTGGVASGRVCPAACAAGLFLKHSQTVHHLASFKHKNYSIIHSYGNKNKYLIFLPVGLGWAMLLYQPVFLLLFLCPWTHSEEDTGMEDNTKSEDKVGTEDNTVQVPGPDKESVLENKAQPENYTVSGDKAELEDDSVSEDKMESFDYTVLEYKAKPVDNAISRDEARSEENVGQEDNTDLKDNAGSEHNIGSEDMPVSDGNAETRTILRCQRRGTNGQDYKHTVSKSKTGKQCRSWRETTHGKKGQGTQGGHNYCRNPDNETRDGGGVWCYVKNPDKESKGTNSGNGKWEHCSVPWCRKMPQNRMMLENHYHQRILPEKVNFVKYRFWQPKL